MRFYCNKISLPNIEFHLNIWDYKSKCASHNLMPHYIAHLWNRKHPQVWTTSLFMQIQHAQRRAYLSLFHCTTVVPKGRLCLAFINLPLEALFTTKELLASQNWFLFTSISCDTQKEAPARALQPNSPWEFDTLHDLRPVANAFHNHSHHLFIMSWTWRVLKADVTHDDLTSMGEWTRWLIVSKTNTLIISRRAQCNRSLTINLYLS